MARPSYLSEIPNYHDSAFNPDALAKARAAKGFFPQLTDGIILLVHFVTALVPALWQVYYASFLQLLKMKKIQGDVQCKSLHVWVRHSW